jgi:electron transfer flavoprotein alpha subunit
MADYKNILIFGEFDGDRVAPITTQLIRIGKSLSEDMNEELHLVFLDGEPQSAAAEGYGYGADKVFVGADPMLKDYLTDTYLQAMEKVVEELKPSILIFGQDDKGLDLAPRLAWRLKTGVTLDSVDLKIDSEKGLLEPVKPVFGGKAHVHYISAEGRPQIATVRDGSFDPAEYDESKKGDLVDLALSLDASVVKTRFLKKEEDESLALALKLASANVVISGGRGLKKKEGVDLLQETADLLQGAIAGSRPAVDYGWMPSTVQIGLTGKKVNPQVYLAVGISGALQHMAGCSKSKTIVAINSDESAPIFKLSHFGVIGDYKGVMEGFNDELKKIKG